MENYSIFYLEECPLALFVSRISWSTYKSDYYCMNNGAKKGVINFPDLGIVYNDDLS